MVMLTSLARFAANLGPVVWKIASRKIESVLPAGLKFGPGLVGENRTAEQPQCSFSDKKRSSDSASDNPPGIFLSAATSGSNSIAASISPLGGREDTETSQNDLVSAPSHQFQQKHLSHSGINGSIGGSGVGYSSQMGLMAGKADMLLHAATNAGLLRKSYNKQDLVPFAPDLNVRFLAPVSPSSSVPIGSPHHPDLALQL